MQRRNLEYFVAVVDCGSISAAAQKLLVAQPSLSRTIGAMEKQMDCQLLERTGRGVVPTATGQQLYYYARSILDKFEMLERLYHGGEEQLVSRLHVSVALLFLKDILLENFYRQMHTPDAEICFYETTLEPLLEQVAEGSTELGLAVVNDYQMPVFNRMSLARGLEVVPLDQAQLPYVNVHGSHPLAQYRELSFRQLFDFPRLLPPRRLFQSSEPDRAGRNGAPRRQTTTYHRGKQLPHHAAHAAPYPQLYDRKRVAEAGTCLFGRGQHSAGRCTRATNVGACAAPAPALVPLCTAVSCRFFGGSTSAHDITLWLHLDMVKLVFVGSSSLWYHTPRTKKRRRMMP